MRIKKIIGVIFVLLIMLILVACGGKTDDETGNKDKAVPVYQGMVVSKDLDTGRTGMSFSLMSASNDEKEDIDQDDPYDNFDGTTIEDEIRSELDVITSDDVEYFVEKDTDFYITIKLSNPDNYEILSFTLNGKFYQSYQFEYGSDSENLILKANSGEVSGIKDFTIDTIKYIDRSEINDVIFAGEKTVKVGVTYDNLPYARTSDLNIGTNSISFNAEIADTNNLIELYNSPLKVYLYDGDNIVDSKDLNVGSNDVKFSKLKQDTLYQYALVTSYDSLDGNGNVMVVLEKHAFYTNEMLMIDEVVSNQESMSFEIIIDDKENLGGIKSIELYQEDELVKSLEDLNLREFNDLLSNNVYEIRVTYEYDLNDGAGVQEVIAKKAVTTLEKATPSLDIVNLDETQDSVSFELEIVDVDKVGEIKSIKLYQEDELVKSLEDLNLREFNELLSNNVYEIRVTYEYDLNDGLGLRNKVFIKELLTYAIPIVITDLEILNTVNPKVGEEVHVRINYDNPSNLNITSFYVNDQKVNVVTSTSSNNSILKFIPEFEGGIYSVLITAIDYESYGHIKSLEISSLFEDDILVMGSLGIESIQEENGNDYIYSGKENYIIVNLNNPTGYDIKKVSLNIGDYEHEEIDVINENQIRFKLKGYISHYNLISMTSITYGMEDYEYTTKTISGVEVVLYGVNSDEVRYISTIEELQNLEDGYIYELTNDIDASGFKWIPYEFRGVIYGNGFKITSLSIVIENESTDKQYYGLFSKLSNGLISSIGVKDSYISIKTKGHAVVGGLVGEIYSSTVTNSYVEDTTLTVTTDSHAYVGGLVGGSFYSEITNSYVEDTTLTVTTDSDAYVGGLVGYSFSSETTNSYVENTTLIVESKVYPNVGGLVGYSFSSETTNSYVENTTLTVTTDSNAGVGGLVGGGNDTSEITNSYVENTTLIVTTESKTPANVGGLVGFSSSSEITNSYVSFDTTIEVNNEIVEITDQIIYLEDLNSKEFYIDVLKWDENIWNLDDLDYENNLRPKLMKD